MESLGKYAFVFAFVAPFSFLTDLGVNLLIIREGARDRARLPSYVNNAFGLSTALFFLTLLLIFIGICLFKRPWDIRIAGLHIVVGIYTQILRGPFYALERMEYETISQTTRRILSIANGFA